MARPSASCLFPAVAHAPPGFWPLICISFLLCCLTSHWARQSHFMSFYSRPLSPSLQHCQLFPEQGVHLALLPARGCFLLQLEATPSSVLSADLGANTSKCTLPLTTTSQTHKPIQMTSIKHVKMRARQSPRSCLHQRLRLSQFHRSSAVVQ